MRAGGDLPERADAPGWRRFVTPFAAQAALVFALSLLLLWLTSPASVLAAHTPYNHFALLAESWLDGRLSLAGPPPAYTQYNDFAVFEGKTFISFPPLPALYLVPAVWAAGSAEAVRDGLWFLPLAAAIPCAMLAVLRRLAELGAVALPAGQRLGLALATVFGTVLWFSSVQGTVWFAAHVLGALLAALYLWAALGAERPLLAGLLLGLATATRTSLGFAAVLFVLELWRTQREDVPRVARSALRFLLPLACIGALLAWHNHARFGDALEFGHRHLDVVWRPRIEKWGLFSTHFLGRNLGVMLASLPWSGGQAAPFRITGHGLALWITSPFYLVLLLSRARKVVRRDVLLSLGITALAVALPSLLYQNTGWVQFGYRFSNDYVVFLMAMLAIVLSDRPRLRPLFWSLVLVGALVNAFGALSFGDARYARYYVYDVSPRLIFEPD